MSAIVGDVDRFKRVNDDHGHGVGDAVLKEIVRRLSDCLSAFEPVYRMGGEEFLILLPGLHTAAAEEVALRMWEAVRAQPIAGVRVTMSFGVATSGAEGFDFDALFARADEALYAAKRGGRDWVRLARADGAAPVSPLAAATWQPGSTAGASAVGDGDCGAEQADGEIGWTRESDHGMRVASA